MTTDVTAAIQDDASAAPTPAETLELRRLDPAARNLAWKLNWYRQSELEGALLLGRMVRFATDGALIRNLMTHCADEARHGLLWATCIQELDLPFVRIHRSYQSFFLEHGGAPTNLTDVLAFTQVFERRVHKRFSDELTAPGLPHAARRMFEVMLEDENGHLEWVHAWLQPRAEARALLNKYLEIDQRVYERINLYQDRLYELEGLGVELSSADEHTLRRELAR